MASNVQGYMHGCVSCVVSDPHVYAPLRARVGSYIVSSLTFNIVCYSITIDVVIYKTMLGNSIISRTYYVVDSKYYILCTYGSFNDKERQNYE